MTSALFLKSSMLILLVATTTLPAQSPVGTLAGTVTDPTGAVIPKARLTIVNLQTGLSRIITTGEDGAYAAASLPVGVYEVRADADGFRALTREAILEAGSNTKLDLSLGVGQLIEDVRVEAVTPQIQYDSHQVGGLISRVQIENLPLNGRTSWSWPNWNRA